MAEEAPTPLAAEFIAAMNRVAVEVHGLRDDLARIYGRDASGRLLAVPPQNGEPAAMPKPQWTPRDVKDVLGSIFGGEPPKKRRR